MQVPVSLMALRILPRVRVLIHRETEVRPLIRAFRRVIRPAILVVIRALPSPEGCGCAARKRWLIAQIEMI